MNSHVRGKVVDLKAVMTGRTNAEELQKTVATREELADHHPAHAIYIYAQNQVSVMSEQLTALKEMDRFVKLIAKAEDEYMPSGPPNEPVDALLLHLLGVLRCLRRALPKRPSAPRRWR